MPELTLLIAYGYLILLAWVFADQAALPLPGEPILVGAGVLAGTGSLDIVTVLLVATGAIIIRARASEKPAWASAGIIPTPRPIGPVQNFEPLPASSGRVSRGV